MSKRLPYFQFEPAEWLAGDIMFCTLQAQGLFATIKALYWQKDCDLSIEQAIKRLKNEELFEELISEKIIKIKSGKIRINFLDEQWEKLSEKSKINSKNGALGGRPKKQIESENKPNGFNPLSENETETKALRKEEIRKEEIRKEDNKIKENFKEEEKKSQNEIFGIELLESQTWIETISMQNKIASEEIKNWIEIFNQKLITELDTKISKKDYAGHFSRWLPGEILKIKKEGYGKSESLARPSARNR
jgi:hypothetical protein